MARKAQRRGHGEGTVYVNSRGQYVAEREVDGKRLRAYGRDRTAARGALAELVRQHSAGTLSTDRRVTVEHAVRRFLDRAVPNRAGGSLAPATRTQHAWAGGHIIAGLGSKRLDRLTVQHVEDFLDTLTSTRAARPMSRSSLRLVRGTLALALDEAVRRRELVHNVARSAHLPADAAPTAPRRSLTPDEARTLLAELRTEPNGAMFGIMLRLGLRPGEAAGLLWSSIDGHVLTVSRARQVAGGRVHLVDELKTTAARRSLEVPDDLVAWLGEHRRAQAAQRLAARDWHDPALMFASPTGRLVDPHHGRSQLRAVCLRAGVPTITPNELRHSCASLLADEGVRNEDIADLLGHTTTRMVEQTYRHRLRPTIDVARRASWATLPEAREGR